MAEDTAKVSDTVAKLSPFKREPKPAAKPKAAPAKKRGPKKDLSAGCTMVYGMAGGVLSMRGEIAGRIMQVQAPVAGKKLSRWVREHDMVYNIVSPLLGASEVELLTDVFGPPMLVAMLQHSTRTDEEGRSFSPLYPVLRPLLMPMMLKLFKELKTVQAKEEEFFAELAELSGTDEDTGAEFEAFLAGLGLAGPEPQGVQEVPVAGDGEGPSDGDLQDYEPRHA